MQYRTKKHWIKVVTYPLTLTIALFSTGNNTYAQQQIPYNPPPQSIVDLVDAPQIPQINISPNGRWMLILEAPGFQPVEHIAQPVLGVAGLRINPITYTTVAENAGTFKSIRIKNLKNGEEFTLKGLPQELQLSDLSWSPTETAFAFLNKTLKQTELWIADLEGRAVNKLMDKVNDTFGKAFQWKDKDTLLVQRITHVGKSVPQANPVPTGPIVQENLGGITPSRTYQNLLANAHDEDLMEFYLTSDLVEVDNQGQINEIGLSGIFKSVSYSPDKSLLLAERIVRPYSYLVPLYLFPTEVTVYQTNGTLVNTLHTIPLADNLPISFDAVVEGPRNFTWRKDQNATLTYVIARDKGNPNEVTDSRDELLQLSAPFRLEDAKVLYNSKYRIRQVKWATDFCIIEENWRKDRTSRLVLLDKGKELKVLVNRKSEDTYTDPGDFLLDQKGLLRTDKKGNVYTQGLGASPEGDRPFLLRWNVLSSKQDTLYKSQRNYYEEPLYYNEDGTVYISRESSTESPNIFSITLKDKKEKQLTTFADPYPSLQNVEKTLLSYPRKDGLNLSATLYLPEGFKKGEDSPLPVLIWAYPREFKTKAAAGQVKGSPHRYPRLAFRSPVYWVTQGYAVLDQADMPIVGEGDSEPNDTFIQQIEDNAHALIDYIVDMGIADRNRIGVGGHSYGAFMTANLLAHTDLFAAGIARSGAYNRTLTPFGFQGEARTYWQAKETYDAMSPFNYAPQIKKPLLITHGMDDENSGTFPIQSERLYAAIKGHGGIVRLVLLPKEFHGYRSREGVLHTFWEQHQWLEKYVKNKGKEQ